MIKEFGLDNVDQDFLLCLFCLIHWRLNKKMPYILTWRMMLQAIVKVGIMYTE